MAAQDLETIPIHDKQYVKLQDAAKYLGISRQWLANLIILGKIESEKIESLQLIELGVLIEYARKRKQSLWDRLEEWRENNK